MADTPVGSLPAITNIALTDELYVNDSGVGKKISYENLLDVTPLTAHAAIDDDTDELILDDNGTPKRLELGTLINETLSRVPSVNDNYLINGAMDIWQRGTSITGLVNGQYTADRWKFRHSGSSSWAAVRLTDVPTVSQAEMKANYSLRLTCQGVDTTLGTTDITAFEQVIEGYNFKHLYGRTATISFWVKLPVAGNYYISFANHSETYSKVVGYNIAPSEINGWVKKSVTVDFDMPAGSWLFTNGAGLKVRWCLRGGSTYHAATENTWETANRFCMSDQVDIAGVLNHDIRIAMVKFEEGTSATAFKARDYGMELLLCKRYFERIGETANSYLGMGQATSTANAQFVIDYVPKRTVPVASVSASNGFQITNSSGTAYTTDGAFVVTPRFETARITLADSVSNPLVVGNAVYSVVLANNYIELDAEL